MAYPSLVSDHDRSKEIIQRLRDDGGRVTHPRRLVVEALVRGPGHHLTAADIVAVLRADDPDFYESTVYRTLERLVELGIVERMQIGRGAAVFHLAHRPHHHLVCETCGEVLEIAAESLDGLAQELHAEHGVVLRPSTLVGHCARCHASAAS